LTRRGAGYLTRPDNKGAKAGNINAAIRATSAPFFLVLYADFVPQTRFLYRAMGFFEDTAIGIVQIPHNFFNADPMQPSLVMGKVMPDDQRFFFEAIMPGRDGYDCAFCCGSNGIVRRSALEEVGGAMPTGSITEDMLLTLALKRKGYVTRYLDEKLAYGLAPESINAFFIQRARWARGAIQILFLPDGPLLSPGLRWYERAFFLPLHWISQTVAQSLSMVIPAIFLLTGVPPLVGATVDEILMVQAPAILATVVTVRLLAPREYHPLAATAHAVLQAFRLLPVVLATLLRPYGHAFKVTPKGGEGLAVQDRTTLFVCFGICAATTLGLALNAHYPTEIVSTWHMVPVVTCWAIFNMIVLLIVAKVAVTPPARRKEERFAVEEPVRVHLGPGQTALGTTCDMSVSGALLRLEDGVEPPVGEGFGAGTWLGVELAGVGLVPAQLRRAVRRNGAWHLGVAFAIVGSDEDDADLRAERSVARTEVDELARLQVDGASVEVRLRDISFGGAMVQLSSGMAAPGRDATLVLRLEGGACAPAALAWSEGGPETGVRLGLRFSMIDTDLRLQIVEKLFTAIPDGHVTNDAGWRILRRLMSGILTPDTAKVFAEGAQPSSASMVLPDWLCDLLLEDGLEDGKGSAGSWGEELRALGPAPARQGVA
jgi:cellulose synthase (UDP-forming)